MMADTDCEHPVGRQMIINGVVHCLDCKMDMYSGRCRRCGHPLDNHLDIGTPAQLCPTDGGIAVREP